jgi:glycolate oxidase FAD binding subunit
VLGAQLVLADGTVARSGGRVVKNVAGYDIARLLAGSVGTLAVLSEVAFRLHPAAPSRLAVVWDVHDAARAAAVARSLDAAPTRVETIEVAWPERLAWTTVAGNGEVVREQARALLAQIPGGSAEQEAPALEPLRAAPGALLGFGVPTTATAALLELAERTATHVRLRAGIGVGDARTGADTAFADGVRALGGHVAPRRSTSVGYDRDPVALDLMRALKQRLDPDGRLSPGRLWEAT